MMKSLENSLFFPIASVSLLVFIIFSIVSYGIIEKSVTDAMLDNYNTSAEVFSDSVRENVVAGVEAEAFRRCNGYFKNKSIVGLSILTGDGRAICNLKKDKEDKGYEVRKKLYFDEQETEAAGEIRITFINESGSRLLVKSVTLLVLSNIFLGLIFFLIGKYLIRQKVKLIVNLANELEDKNLTALKDVTSRLPESPEREIDMLYRGVENQANKVERFQNELLASEKIKAQNEISSLLAHDIKAPLTSLLTVAKDESLDPMLSRVLNNGVNGINELIEEMLSLDKIDKAKNWHAKELVDVESFIGDMYEVLNYTQKSSKNTKVEFLNLCRTDKMTVAVSPTLFRRAISNLFKNAVEAIETNAGHKKIVVSIEKENGFANIIVSDSGRGMDKDIIERLGERGLTKGKEEGKGFGLYQVVQMLNTCGGDIDVKVTQQVGTEIRLRIPLVNISAPRLNLELEDPSQSILILDDEKIVHDTWELHFKDQKVLNPVFYFSTAEELEAWIEEHPDKTLRAVAAFDNNLKQDVTGLELLLKNNFLNKHLVTGDSKSVEVATRCFENEINLVDKLLIPKINICLKAKLSV